jgi:hypothetical protein
MAVVTWRDSRISEGNVVGAPPGLWLASSLFEVMPVFFVGGFGNSTALEAARRHGGGALEASVRAGEHAFPDSA